DPAAPLGHHAQDFTHTTFGVVTLGVFTRQVRVEASAFNGAHPDDVRTNFDPVRLDSYSARLTCNPASQWSVAAWFGHVAASGGAHVHGALDRFGASVLHSRGTWSTTFVYGADLPAGAGHPLNTLLLESTLELGAADAVYGRAEYVRRTAADLALVGSVSRELDIGAVSLGYERALWRSALVATGLGARGTLNLVPEELRLFYGSRTPVGLMAYVQVRPSTDRRKGGSRAARAFTAPARSRDCRSRRRCASGTCCFSQDRSGTCRERASSPMAVLRGRRARCSRI